MTSTAPAGKPERIRVYWAEDDFGDQFLIRNVTRDLRPQPDITFFANGQELLDALTDEVPGLVVLDIRMPTLSGMETLETIRKRPSLKRLRVIMFSTAMVDSEVATCKSLGVEAFVQKPNSYADFAEAVTSILDGTASQRRPWPGRGLPVAT